MGSSDQQIELVFDVLPMGAKRPRVTRRGTYNEPEYTSYKIQLKYLFKRSYPHHIPFEDPIEMDLHFEFVKSKSCKKTDHVKKPDLSNLIKSVEDALNGVAYKDDAQIVTLVCNKRYSDKNQIRIKIKPHGKN